MFIFRYACPACGGDEEIEVERGELFPGFKIWCSVCAKYILKLVPTKRG